MDSHHCKYIVNILPLPDDYFKKTKKFKLMFCGQPHVNAVALFDEIEEFF